MKISIFGLGYVGAVSIGCLAKLGHQVIGVDTNQDKIKSINEGRAPVIEPGLDELIQTARAEGLITATHSVAEAVSKSDVAMVCVGTPSSRSGGLDDTQLIRVIEQIAAELKDSSVNRDFCVITRSTCLPYTHRRLKQILEDVSGNSRNVSYVCHPEFLRECSAVSDFFAPPKIVFGTDAESAKKVCGQLYPEIVAPTFYVGIDVASMIKYADNCFHATKVTFANEIGILCRELGVDAQHVMRVFCEDKKLNISARYLRPGGPFGGSCLPKDLRAMLDLARRTAVETPLLSGVLESNRVQVESIVERALHENCRRVGIIGLAFKDGTDDLRESPAVAVAEQLCGKGVAVRIFDRTLSIARILGANRRFALERIPHLETLLTQDLAEVFATSELVLMFHRLSPEDQATASSGGAPTVIDFTGSWVARSPVTHEAGVL